MEMKKHNGNMPGKRARRRLRAQVRLLRKQVDTMKVAMRGRAIAPIAAELPRVPSAAMIYASELNAIRQYVLEYPNLETGGSLYGWYSETGLPIIALATGPDRNAMHESTRFHADEQYSMEIGQKVVNYGLQHVGEWHSHHTLGLAQPSGIDCRAMQASIGCSPAGRFLCGIANIVGDTVMFNLFFFSTETGLTYAGTPIVVRDGDSPVRIGLDKILGSFEKERGAV